MRRISNPLLDQLRMLLDAHVNAQRTVPASFPEAIPYMGAPPVRQLSFEEQARFLGQGNPLATRRPTAAPRGRGPGATGGFMYRGVFRPWGARMARPPRPPRMARPLPPPPPMQNNPLQLPDPFYGNDPYIDNQAVGDQTQRFYNTPPPPMLTDGNPLRGGGGGVIHQTEDNVIHQTEDNILGPYPR